MLNSLISPKNLLLADANELEANLLFMNSNPLLESDDALLLNDEEDGEDLLLHGGLDNVKTIDILNMLDDPLVNEEYMTVTTPKTKNNN